MSSTALPITPESFALAIHDLPLSNLHTKAAELLNSIAHLHHSNEQLKPFADDGDEDCRDAIRENLVVLNRMAERVALLRQEVEGRGYRWFEAEGEDKETREEGNGNGEASTNGERVNGVTSNGSSTRGQRGGEAPRGTRLRQQMDVDDDPDEDDGVHL
ncbi:MAG: hypothetical protein M1817_006848 [Caeruleum heppii]|nr:MAG: hypothetical protein M1817_006848 [Caeruleum heppii]